MKYISILSFVFVFLLSTSCVKEEGPGVYNDPVSFSGLAVFNAIPNSTGVNLLIDGNRLNTTNDKLSFGGHMSHRNVYPGAKVLTIENLDEKGQTQRIVHNLSLTSGAIYSLFLYEEEGEKSILSQDNIVMPRAGYAKIRLVHMVKDAPTLTLSEGKSDHSIQKGVGFKTVTDFVEVKVGDGQRFKIVPTDSEESLPEIILNDFNLEDKAIYTFMVKGRIAATTDKEQVSLSVIKL